MKLRKTLPNSWNGCHCYVNVGSEKFDVKLYNSRPPYDNGDSQDTAKVRVFLPYEKEATGRAVVICPGGGYSSLQWTKKAMTGENTSRIWV